jgi:hypothetical protein
LLLTIDCVSAVKWIQRLRTYVIVHLIHSFDTFSTEKVLERLLLLTVIMA